MRSRKISDHLPRLRPTSTRAKAEVSPVHGAVDGLSGRGQAFGVLACGAVDFVFEGFHEAGWSVLVRWEEKGNVGRVAYR